MLHLNRQSIQKDEKEWKNQGFQLYSFDAEKVKENTKEKPTWLHVGGGNIFRAFVAPLQQALLEDGTADTGISVMTTHNMAVIDDVYRPYDNLSVAVTMYADGHFAKQVVGNIVESLGCVRNREQDWQRLVEIFTAPTLQIVSFTITEKGYKLTNYNGDYFEDVQADLLKGPDQTQSGMGNLAALTYARYKSGAAPFAFLSLDNCSHNGDVIKHVIQTFADNWYKNGLVDADFLTYVNEKITYPYSMIDKIVPAPSAKVQAYLQKCHFADTEFIQAGRSTYAIFVNAEEAQYLVVEDNFPNGRPPLEKAGVIFTDRETVNKVERMKVGTCLNPLHTTLAVYGCLLGDTLIADEMKDAELKKLIEHIGYDEGLPVVVNPGVINPKAFIDELISKRLPNPNVPDTPQRIATDTSQKVGVRFGETIKAYGDKAHTLEYIPLAIAGWCRYLLAVDDEGKPFELSPDPLLKDLQDALQGITLGNPASAKGKLKSILANKDIFGSDLYEVGLGKKIEGYFDELIAGPHAVRNTLVKYVK